MYTGKSGSPNRQRRAWAAEVSGAAPRGNSNPIPNTDHLG